MSLSSMTALDKCATVCAMLSRLDSPNGVAIAAEAIAIYERSAGPDVFQRARALETLAFKLAVETEPTSVAIALDGAIAARIRKLGSLAA